MLPEESGDGGQEDESNRVINRSAPPRAGTGICTGLGGGPKGYKGSFSQDESGEVSWKRSYTWVG